MRISRSPTPCNKERLSTGSTIFLLACAATLTIWNPDPFFAWAYEAAAFALAAASCLGGSFLVSWWLFPLSGIALWGFGQLAIGATVYGWATLNASLQNAALAATFLAGYQAFGNQGARRQFRLWFGRFGFALSLVCVAAYFTSTGKILWLFPSPYPDNWGPFLSRNNFAQFLELCFPMALYECARRERIRSQMVNVLSPAVILAAGFASASRAGSLLLAAEAVAGFVLMRGTLRRRAVPFLAATAAMATLAGVATLAGRFAQQDPMKYRREIFQSSAAMIASRPWQGYGLGTFSTVYPEFAVFDSGATVDHAHNDWLEWSAEGGIPLALLWAMLAGGAVLPAIRSRWGLGIPAVFLHALVDYPFARLGVSIWAFLLLALLAREERGRPGVQREECAEPRTKKERKLVKLETVQSVVAMTLVPLLALAALAIMPGGVRAAPPTIGTVTAQGSFRIDEATVRGNATLFEGATVETYLASTDLVLGSGARVALLQESKGRVFGDHLVLEKGSGRLDRPSGFRLEARGLTVQPQTGDASARVTLAGTRRVQVNALAGSFRVLTSRGLLVADVAAGTALEFEPPQQSGGGEPWKLTGCLRTVAGHFLLTDEITKVTVEVKGTGVDKESGNRVEITGAMDPTATPVSGATQFIRATQVRQLSKGCPGGKAAPAAAAAGAAGGAAAHAGAISATTIAIIGGVSAAAVVGGLAAAEALPGQGGAPSVSR